MLTNPATRDWTVTASTVRDAQRDVRQPHLCGIGRGDSAVRVSGKPSSLGTLRESSTSSGSWPTGAGRLRRRDHPAAVGVGQPARGLGRRLRAAGAELTGEVATVHPAARRPRHRAWTIAAVRDAAAAAGRDPARHDLRRRPGVRRRRPRHMREQCRWFGGWSATTSPTSSRGTARTAGRSRGADRLHRGPQGYDYNEHGQAGNTHAAFVPDEIVDRFCILGPVEEHVRRLTSCATWASTSSPSTCSTTARTGRCAVRRERHPRADGAHARHVVMRGRTLRG